ncbi:hypothetical protein EMUR_03300 [Ehrlichia muris AS145]|uniref:Uncharacterized protein n=2 Tax=Ehrlichia muris TaxID=35795 RepID=V9R7Y0_9RICK|nr:hypothetical protein EMUR_03300 [Ehrlichia muris AS145]
MIISFINSTVGFTYDLHSSGNAYDVNTKDIKYLDKKKSANYDESYAERNDDDLDDAKEDMYDDEFDDDEEDMYDDEFDDDEEDMYDDEFDDDEEGMSIEGNDDATKDVNDQDINIKSKKISDSSLLKSGDEKKDQQLKVPDKNVVEDKSNGKKKLLKY